MSGSYTVMVDGVPVQCDTAEAALALAKLASGGVAQHAAPKGGHNGGGGNTRWTEQRVREFFKLIEGKQRKLIDALLETEDTRTDDQLQGTVGVSNGMALAGVFAGLFKNAKKVGADPKELYYKRAINIGDKKGYEYGLHDGFRKAAAHRAK